jgi:hypothetical protein
VQRAPFRPGDVVTCGSLVMRMIPDTARATSSMAPQSYTPSSGNTPPPAMQHPTLQPAGRSQQATSAMDVRSGRTPPSGSPADVRSGRTPPSGYPSDVRSGRTPPTGTPSFGGGGDLAEERRRREEAEAAVLSAADRVKIAEARAAEFEAGAREAAQLRRRVAELEQRAQGGGGGDSDDAAKLRRQVEQMQADMRRMRAGGGDAGKMAELTEQLRRAESDRDALRVQLSQQPASGGGADPAAADAAIALGDALAELRSSLRAASDEATALTAPSQSVAVVTDALGQATEQLESARGHLRSLGKLLGVA